MNPAPQISGKKVTVLLYTAVLITISGVVGFAYFLGRPGDKPLPVRIEIGRKPVPVPDQSGALVTDVVVINNQSEHSIPKLDVSINGQYFLYRDSPLEPGEELVVPQSIFSTKSNQRYNPQRYPVESITVTGRLPSGARGVQKIEFSK